MNDDLQRQQLQNHIAEYGPILTASIDMPIPEYWKSPEGPYWYTCPEGHVHWKETA